MERSRGDTDEPPVLFVREIPPLEPFIEGFEGHLGNSRGLCPGVNQWTV